MHTFPFPKPPCQLNDLRAGNIEALTCYCYRYLKPLTRYTSFVIKNEFAAEDLATINMEQLWHSRHDMDSDRAVHTFLRKNMYRICCQWLHEQLILQGYLTTPPGWSPKYSKKDNTSPSIQKSNLSTSPEPGNEPNPPPKTNANP